MSTLSFRLLYVLFVIRHGRRQIVHFKVTDHPTSAWVVQQIREAFPFDSAPTHLIQTHLRRLLREYVEYHHDDRTHYGLGKYTPMWRTVEHQPSPDAKVIALPRVGGLHHRYTWRVAA